MRIAIARSPPPGREPYSGYLDPVLRELFARAGIHHELVTIPAARVFGEADSGNLDAAISPVRSAGAEFPRLLSMSESILPVELAGLYTRNDIRLSSVEDFFDYRLAHIRGWKPAEKYFSEHQRVELARNPGVLMSMLLHDRVDVVFYATYPGRYLANEIGLMNLKVSEFHVSIDVYLHLNKRHARLLPIIEASLLDMKADGSLDSILAEHGIRR
ncbi:substrate-binding periplasmic protein [Granulosicoccus sp. 3-233]|uniref:substrate-binding periplasmic protein n=1 Tax=Granulosicoccus sp. 3-233 TaxID=3417969 RepID=UPI003D350D21